ncbi:winged helix-turn-helix domain-containing protein [Lysobacter sp. S4-A87]|uniref:winged helix-turn-helix domain-containing protein n=1 Tax=Lysobacter sp. S4-A87 TaxID=2925843 RepID=UPI001F5325D9|nr:winged helix-turn-helix domain-containing protein [Lysobacter sp. S4-A87]UNK48474.1 winged helix-turn-helix domain-containing protein [Lysobacter sp. S4-A87]
MRFIRYRFGEFELDPASRELWCSGERRPVPLKSLECLAYLVAHRERAVGRDELISAVWGRTEVSDTVVAQTMRRARKALDDAGDRQTIVRTVQNFGYRWVAPVEVVEARAEESNARTAAAPEATPLTEAAGQSPVSTPVPEPSPAPAPDRTDAQSSPGVAAGARRPWPRLLAAGLLVIVLIAGAWWLRENRSGTQTAPPAAVANGVIVLPVSIEPPDPEFTWVRLGAMEYVAGRLRASELKVTPSEQTLHLNAAMGKDVNAGTAMPSDAQLQQVLAESGAHWLLVPHAQRDRDRWRVQLRALDRRSEVRVDAQGDTPLQAMAVASDAWMRRIGRAPSALAGPTPLVERLQRVDAELDAGQLDAAREQIVRAPVAQRSDPRMLVREGQLEYRAGRIDEAQQLFDRAMAGDTATADAATRAKGLMGLGAVALRQRRFEDAEARYAQALSLLRAPAGGAEDPVLLGNAYNGRGVARIRRNDLDGAVSDLGLARVAMQQNGDTVSAAMVGSNLGRLEAIRGHLPQAVQEFDSSIAVFERYQVLDYLAATLQAKASAQLAMVQPAQALQTLERTRPLSGSIEDPTLRSALAITQVGVLIANGLLDGAQRELQALPDDPVDDTDGTLSGLKMRLAIARGDRAQAAALAARVRPASPPTDDGVVVTAVQAAGNATDARGWRALITPEPSSNSDESALTAMFATAVVERRFGDRRAALAAATSAALLAGRDGSPDDRLRMSVIRALLLIDDGQLQEATAVLGELDPYASVDYRVAWLAWTLYQRSGNPAMAKRSLARAEALRGQRPLMAEPLL